MSKVPHKEVAHKPSTLPAEKGKSVTAWPAQNYRTGTAAIVLFPTSVEDEPGFASDSTAPAYIPGYRGHIIKSLDISDFGSLELQAESGIDQRQDSFGIKSALYDDLLVANLDIPLPGKDVFLYVNELPNVTTTVIKNRWSRFYSDVIRSRKLGDENKLISRYYDQKLSTDLLLEYLKDTSLVTDATGSGETDVIRTLTKLSKEYGEDLVYRLIGVLAVWSDYKINNDIASEAIKFLGLLEPEVCADERLALLREVIKHEDPSVRDAAIVSLASCELDAAIQILKGVAETEPSKALRKEIREAIEDLCA